jgi:hypothetical protein
MAALGLAWVGSGYANEGTTLVLAQGVALDAVVLAVGTHADLTVPLPGGAQ